MKTVLIIDDSNIIRIVLTKGLTEKGFLVIGAASKGADGLEMAITHNPDYLIIDNLLPDAVGTDIARTLLEEEGLQTKIFMLSSLESEQVKASAAEAGIKSFITKPSDYQQLVDEVYLAITRLT